MRVYEENRQLPYTAAQMFNLVVDVERYPAFLPGYLDARVRRHLGDTLYVEQTVGAGGIRWRFDSVATARRPESLAIRSAGDPFRHLAIDWRFTDTAGGCHVVFRLTYEVKSRFLGALIGMLVDAFAKQIVNAFLQEARRLYGMP